MLDKNRVKPWVKVVAWSLAIVFGTSFSFLFMMPSTQQSTSSSGSSRSSSPIINTTDAEQARLLTGQAEVAHDDGDFDQAINFYEQALALDDSGPEIKTGLAAAYYEKGKAVQSEDATAAKDAFARYLEVLPDGPKAAEVQELLNPTE